MLDGSISSCTTPSHPQNGRVLVSGSGSNAIATYSCNREYTLSGSICTNGRWPGIAPTCEELGKN